MEGLLPIIAVIVYGIVKALSGNNGQNQNNKPTSNRSSSIPKPTPTPSGGQERTRQTSQQAAPSNTSIEEQQKMQMEQLKSRLNTGTNVYMEEVNQQDMTLGKGIQDAIKHQTTNKNKQAKEQFKKEVKTGLNHSGIVNGIIMSEVLGPPRARKPYQNVVVERKRQLHR